MKTNVLYRGINEEMYKNANGALRPNGTVVLAGLYPGSNLVPSKNLRPGKSKQNAMDKHQNKNRMHEGDFKKNSAYLSTTPHFEIAKKYATDNYKVEGYVFTIDRTKLADYNVNEYLVSDIASIVCVPEDKEVLLLTNPHGECLNPMVISGIKKVSSNL